MSSQNWVVWALLSAVFAALTAIFAKIGLEGVDSDYATLLRTFVIIIVLSLFVGFTGKWRSPLTLSSKTVAFLTLSALATGGSWVCYFRALKIGEAYRVAPIDKLSVVLVAIFGVLILGERPSARGWVGVAFVSVGAVILTLKG
jgi:transporter family protein